MCDTKITEVLRRQGIQPRVVRQFRGEVSFLGLPREPLIKVGRAVITERLRSDRIPVRVETCRKNVSCEYGLRRDGKHPDLILARNTATFSCRLRWLGKGVPCESNQQEDQP